MIQRLNLIFCCAGGANKIKKELFILSAATDLLEKKIYYSVGGVHCIVVSKLNFTMASLLRQMNNISIRGARLGHVVSRMTTPQPLVLCGPSGAGKSTLMKKLTNEFVNNFGFSVSHTTRQPREGEEHGIHYYFVTREEMQRAISNGEFIEHAEYSGNLYGTSKKAVQDVLSKGKICILDIEIQGVKQVKNTNLQAQYVFIRPPSIEDLKKRLLARGTETDESLARRLSIAEKEMEYGTEEGNFDLVVVNDEVEQAYQDLRDFMLPSIQLQNSD